MNTIPFTMVTGHVTVRAAVAGVEGRFVIDTGCGLTSLDAGWARSLGIAPDAGPQFQAHGTGSVDASFATIPSLRVGDVALGEQQVVLISLDSVSAATGHALHGVIGFDFLSRWVVDIDYEELVIRLHDPASWTYDGSGAIVPVSLQYRIPIVDATVIPSAGVELHARLVLDLGSSRLCARLLAGFAGKHPELLDGGVDAPIGTGVGGEVRGRVRRVDEIRVGALTVRHPTTGVAADSRGAMGLSIFDGTLGTPLFERTRMIVDYARERIILEPRAGFDAPYEHELLP
ncbi:MAG TPA: retropepsin-like aspartic protease [Thermoanaerobaculia bacterium]|nr:retropepsin-like aspartic protease [Thermoanaerobaculia bacterium]